MRFSLVDLLFAVACMVLGLVLGVAQPSRLCPASNWNWAWLTPGLDDAWRIATGVIVGLVIYLALMYPVYRGLRLLPMILPWCPVCGKLEHGYSIVGVDWPRIRLQCPLCEQIFVVWMNGSVGAAEPWDEPVLVLKWPYAAGRYRRVMKSANTSPPMDQG